MSVNEELGKGTRKVFVLRANDNKILFRQHKRASNRISISGAESKEITGRDYISFV